MKINKEQIRKLNILLIPYKFSCNKYLHKEIKLHENLKFNINHNLMVNLLCDFNEDNELIIVVDIIKRSPFDIINSYYLFKDGYCELVEWR